MAKDRARPFSRKHRKYWLTVTGGMIVIGVINVAIGMCAYHRAPETVERMELNIPAPSPNAGPAPVKPPPGMLGLGELPVAVMKSFTAAFPQHVPSGARKVGTDEYELYFKHDDKRMAARFRADGTRTDTP